MNKKRIVQITCICVVFLMLIISVNKMKAGGACPEIHTPFVGTLDMHYGGCVAEADPINCSDCIPIY